MQPTTISARQNKKSKGNFKSIFRILTHSIERHGIN